MKILIDNGHGIDTKGKRSPDGQLLEYAQNRLLAGRIVTDLQARGLDASLLVPEETDISLPERCRRVNEICRLLGKDNVILISIHANAAGKGDKWLDATGWCAYATRGVTRANVLATCLYDAAKFHLPGQSPGGCRIVRVINICKKTLKRFCTKGKYPYICINRTRQAS